jgi:hypothetical protein
LSRCNIHPRHISVVVERSLVVLNLQSFLLQPPVSASKLKSDSEAAAKKR